ncbi:MAG TPA: hypothetical protein VLM79_00700 [Kofleriaceae bacterium]|nr:hypothetical protein [Kofleriaceae bacterium]
MDPPIPYVAPGTRARRHRSLTGLSGILLFACMFLPAIQGCNHPVIPYEVPPLLPPYLYGLVFALIAMSWSGKRLGCWVTVLRVLAALVVATSVGLVALVPPAGALELLIGTILLLLVGPGTTERRIASTGLAVGLISMIWFGFWSATPDALLGVYLSFASSVGLLLGSLAWLRDLSRWHGVEMPRAVAARRVGRAPSDILAG